MVRLNTRNSKKETQSDVEIPMEGLLGYQLGRASTAIRVHLAAGYSAIGFRIIEGSVLFMVEANPGITQSQIGNKLDIKSANMAPIVAFLEKNNYIERQRLDGRSQGLFLTSDGHEAVKNLWQCVDENERWIASSIADLNAEKLVSQLNSMWKKS